jgi:poly-gamma-glutamate synthesis protein (capsule biosynthesis protein)
MKLLFGADLGPTKTNFEVFAAGDAAALLSEDLLQLLQQADLRCFDLEVPLTDKDTPIQKHGPKLRAPENTVAGIKAMGINLLTLANNHILDQGQIGLENTLRALDGAGIPHFGTGLYPDCAAPYIFEKDGRKVGIYGCTEHEFSVATEKTPGANPFEPLESPDHVAQLKQQCDYVVVLYHGGKEHYRYPSPGLQKTCRKLVEKGADLVLCQHSHCIGCKEEYQSGTIVYGQGNFLFDRADNDFRNSAILVQVNEDFSVTYVPLLKNGNGVILAQGEAGKEILEAFYARSEEIKDPVFLRKTYETFAKNGGLHYLLLLQNINGQSFLNRLLNKVTKGGWYRFRLRKLAGKKQLALKNYLECEAHRELLLQILSGNEEMDRK